MMATSDWYNNPEFSDLSLQLQDGREIKVHKLVLCTRNKYFNTMCGSSSPFAEAKKNVIELKEDDPDAMEEAIRHLYGCGLPGASRKPWCLWFNLVTTADKYLEPELSKSAESQLRKVAGSCDDTDTVLDIFQSIKSDMSHRESLSKFADSLRKKNLSKLQKNQRYRGLLFNNRDLLESHFDAFHQIMLSQDMVLRSMCMCSWHFELGMRDPGDASNSCFACTKQSADNKIKSHKVYLPKS